ncbi:MAG: ATP-dependent helicase [Actinoallomurus sp.]|nr:ATP-dependent helicase [Actinoallomurus sp.]
MLVAHAIWHGGALCLWAEDPALPATTRVRVTPKPHPFAAADFTGGSYAALTAGAMRVELTLLLPGSAAGPLPSPELAREPSGGRPAAHPWRVPALALDPFAAMALLASAGDADNVVRGADLRFFALVADEAMHLAGRGRVLPALVREDGDLTARWRPVITGVDADRFGELARAMPPACRSADGGRPAAEVLLEALTGLADATVRGIVPHPLLSERTGRVPDRLPLAERWAAALTGPDPFVAREPGDDPDTLAVALDDWAAAARRPSGPLRVCFRLTEPPEDDPGGPWTVQFALQGTDDPSLYVPAAAIWTGEVTSVADAEETLLAGLGRALRLYPQITEALRVATPTSVTTDAEGAFAFLRQAAPLLSAAGFGVQLPQWAGRARLGMKLTTRTQTESGATVSSGFGLGDLVGFRWDLAVEGEDITEEELAELARLKAPLVRLRGRWVELDDAQLAAALEFMSRGRTGEMTAAQAVRAAIHAGDDILPLLEVDADGALGDLLSGEADRRLEPIATPETFEGTLRPYQERGLAWLSFLDGLGLGAVLADDMGLGKCIHPETPVFVNGALIKSKDVWARFAGAVEFDGEGEWARPTEALTTSSVDRTGSVISARISRLYRQHVREPLREITLSDGTSITVTRRHRMLGRDGWTAQIRPGDRVCVPTHLVHKGRPADPDLTVLLAWQISEGHEGNRWTARISQKDIHLLEDLYERIMRVGRRYDLKINEPTVTPANKHQSCAVLRISSKSYAYFLEELGYRWGRVSAHKKIPDFIVSADDATLHLFLRHYFAAESSVDLRMRTVEISSASLFLMQQLSAMLRRFGVWLRITTKMKHATNGARIKRPYYRGLIGGPSARLFRLHVGIADPAKQAKLEAICESPSNTNVEGTPGSDLMAAVSAMDCMLDGRALAEYSALPKSKWTAGTVAAYRQMDRAGLSDIRGALNDRATRQAFYATVVSVEDVDYEGWVYDFEVPEHHNYVAAGTFCHNTAQTLALLEQGRVSGRPVGPTLLIGPMSLVGNWQREAARFTPKLRVYVHHGGARQRGEELAKAVGNADLVLTTYGTAARDRDALAAIEWDRVVCDEAQALKNSATRQAQAVRSIPARGRIALTGTPVENHLTELWSIMEFANPGLLGPRQAFRERFATPIEAHGDEEAAAALGRATGPFILRRLKTDKTIITDLPEKQEIKVWCNLTPEQASLYQATVEDMLDRIANSAGMERRGLVLATMAKLKQVCNHPAHLLKDGSRLPGRSGKLERLEEICAEVVAEGEKALVFTQYSEFGAMLQPHLEARLDRPVLWLHGGTTKRRRDELVRRFQEDTEPGVFLLSLKAAGTGLNLTAANHVVHVDRWWNPAVEDQATDRAFRIGQTKNVQVRKFICVGTMEERVDEMIERKKALAERIVGTGESWLTELSVAELRDVVRLGSEAVSA